QTRPHRRARARAGAHPWRPRLVETRRRRVAHRPRQPFCMNIALSPDAAAHLNEDAGGRLLRIAFTTGCGGSGYRLSYADEPVAEDSIIEVDGLSIALDTMAASRLD